MILPNRINTAFAKSSHQGSAKPRARSCQRRRLGAALRGELGRTRAAVRKDAASAKTDRLPGAEARVLERRGVTAELLVSLQHMPLGGLRGSLAGHVLRSPTGRPAAFSIRIWRNIGDF